MTDDGELLFEEFGDVAAALAELASTAPPAAARESVLAAAVGRRAPGRPVDAVEPSPAPACFDRTAGELRELLAALRPDEWSAAAHPVHGTVRELVAHLVGIELLGAGWLDPEHPAPPVTDHVHAAAAVDGRDAADPAVLVRRLGDAAAAVVAAASAGDPRRRVNAYGVPSGIRGYLVTRTFELWAHGIDIARATGRPEPVLDAPRIATMSATLMAAVPAALARRGAAVPGRTARFVLTGPAGGTYSVPLHPGEPAGDPGAVVVTDPVSICLRAANRMTADDLPVHVDGDAGLARRVIEALDAFAAD